MKIVTADTMAELVARAAAAPRKRINLNLHAEPNDPTSRFLNAGVSGTYVRPHRHRSGKWELLTVLQGRLEVVFFTSGGQIKSRYACGPKDHKLIEIPGGEWHGFVFCAPAAVVLEVKPGPYEPQLDKEFAEWAPPEGDAAADSFLLWLENAKHGEIPPGTRLQL
jgi:cupin fold WbuC family metalloprotein